MNKYLLLAALLTAATPSAAVAQDDPLQPFSRSEYNRAFGTSVRPRSLGINPMLADTLRGADVLTAVTDGQSMANAESVDSNVLLELLSSGTGEVQPLRFLLLWHLVALDATAIDHAADGRSRAFLQVGPARTARALALVHQAMYEVARVFSSGNRYETTLPELALIDVSDASEAAAITEAAYQTLIWLYPNLRETRLRTDRPPVSSVTLPEAGVVAEVGFAAGVSDVSCPTQPVFNLRDYYLCSLDTIEDMAMREKGARIGRTIAAEVRRVRAGDGSDHQEPEFDAPNMSNRFETTLAEGTPRFEFLQWVRDPVSKLTIALGGEWTQVAPFAIPSAYAFRPGEGRAPRVEFSPRTGNAQADLQAIIDAAKSLKSYAAIEKWGGDARLNSSGDADQSQPSQDGFFLAQNWAYDATAYLCAPARMYNQIALAVLRRIAKLGENDPALQGLARIDTMRVVDVARYLALVNFALADAALASWDTKFHFQSPRPVTYIRAVKQLEADLEAMFSEGAGNAVAGSSGTPSDPPEASDAEEDDTPETANGDMEASDGLTRGGLNNVLWYPAGAQVSNSDSPVNITPPFPAYVSGHAAFGGALFGILRQFADPHLEFTYRSDEFNGRNKDAFNYIRCERDGGTLVDEITPAKFCEPRTFTLDCAERENADSRLWMGVHWIHDADDGITMGNQVAREVYGRMMRPVSGNLMSTRFSVDAADYQGENLRTALTCEGLDLPDGWDDPNGQTGFGELVVFDVPRAQ